MLTTCSQLGIKPYLNSLSKAVHLNREVHAGNPIEQSLFFQAPPSAVSCPLCGVIISYRPAWCLTVDSISAPQRRKRLPSLCQTDTIQPLHVVLMCGNSAPSLIFFESLSSCVPSHNNTWLLFFFFPSAPSSSSSFSYYCASSQGQLLLLSCSLRVMKRKTLYRKAFVCWVGWNMKSLILKVQGDEFSAWFLFSWL